MSVAYFFDDSCFLKNIYYTYIICLKRKISKLLQSTKLRMLRNCYQMGVAMAIDLKYKSINQVNTSKLIIKRSCIILKKKIKYNHNKQTSKRFNIVQYNK